MSTPPSATPSPSLRPASTDTGVLIDPDDVMLEDGTLEDEMLSAASSVGSLTLHEAAPQLNRLVDLTDREAYCLCYMTRQSGGVTVPSVCGCPRATCSRGNHQVKQGNGPTARGPGRFYEGFPAGGKQKDYTDGRLDNYPEGFGQEEIATRRAAEALEMTRISAGIRGGNGLDDDDASAMTLEPSAEDPVTPTHGTTHRLTAARGPEVDLSRHVQFTEKTGSNPRAAQLVGADRRR